jgi:hypothetical protein
LAAVCPEAAADLNQAAARAAAAAPLAVQLLRGRDGGDCGSDLGDEPFAAAAGQVPRPAAAAAWLAEALAKVGGAAAEVSSALARVDARALADLAVLLWALAASENLAIALLQPAADAPQGKGR